MPTPWARHVGPHPFVSFGERVLSDEIFHQLSAPLARKTLLITEREFKSVRFLDGGSVGILGGCLGLSVFPQGMRQFYGQDPNHFWVGCRDQLFGNFLPRS